MSGLDRIQYAPAAWINREAYRNLVNPANIWTTEIPFAQGGWLTAPFLPGRLWNEIQLNESGNPFYRQTVSGTTPGLRPGISGELEKMALYDAFLLRLLDRNGQWWTMGTLQQPYRFSADASSRQLAGYELTFTADTSRRAHGYLEAVD